MQWNKKWLILCAAALIAVAGVLLGKGIRQQTTSTPKFASETELAVPISGPAASRSSAEKKEKNDAQKTSPPKKEEKEKKSAAPDKRANPIKKENKSGQKQEKSRKKKTDKEKKPTESGKRNATPIPTQKPQITPAPTPKNEVTVQIQCLSIMNQRSLWKEGIEEIIPASGVFYSGTCSIKNKDTAYDVLKTVCKNNNIALDSQYTPLYGTYYIRGIGNLYQFDCGGESGWKYSVNGVIPGVGCSGYPVKAGDTIVFFFDCRV